MEFIKRQFGALKAFYRKDYSHFLFITAVAFLVLVVLSYVAGLLLREQAMSLMQWFGEQVGNLGVMDEDGFSTLGLFLNNFRAMITGAAYGFIPFIYLPAISLGVNAMLLGAFAAVYSAQGISLLLYLAGILPHGIFELPALVLSVACGLYLCRTITDYVRHNTKGVVRSALANIARVIVINILPLLLIAAVVEANITPAVMKLFA